MSLVFGYLYKEASRLIVIALFYPDNINMDT